MTDFVSVSPFKIMEKSTKRALGPGNLGALIARAGVGKTACLIHIALDKIFRQERLVHVSLGEGPEKIRSYYQVIYSEMNKALGNPEDESGRMLMDRNRMILAYLNQSFEVERLRASLDNLSHTLDFRPMTIIVDGLDFERVSRAVLEDFKQMAGDLGVEIWLSARSHRHIPDVNERGIPYPCDQVDDLFSIIIQLRPEPRGLFLRLLKDHDQPFGPDALLRLDPGTYLVLE